ncbi:MAG: glycosyltransferase family 8 protein [Akkermansia sp.]|nr:glycosyltransferase family 8 protein [Akkermansia sp.]
MEKNEFAVVLASDNRGILPLSVTVYSLLDTAGPNTRYKVYILSDAIQEQEKQQIQKLVSPFDCRLEFIEITNILKEHNFPYTEQWPVPAWGRIFIPDLLKNESGNILYIDIDILICRDLTELFQTDMTGMAVGAVFENFSKPGSHFNERLDIPMDCIGYFNSGVLLMNVDFFREHGLVEKILEYAVSHRDKLTCPDQDALNGTLCRWTKALHPRWNWHDGLTRRILKNDPREKFWRGVTPKQAVEAALEPGILHYQGVHKPWRYNWRYEGARYENMMRKAGLLTGPMPGRTLVAVLKKFLYKPIYKLTARKIHKLRERFDEEG